MTDILPLNWRGHHQKFVGEHLPRSKPLAEHHLDRDRASAGDDATARANSELLRRGGLDLGTVESRAGEGRLEDGRRVSVSALRNIWWADGSLCLLAAGSDSGLGIDK